MTEVNVRCADCGFLALRHKQNLTLHEADERFHESGLLPGKSRDTFEGRAVCFRLAAGLDGEISSQITLHGDRMAHPGLSTREILHRSKACEKFAVWSSGFGPKEHAEAQLLEQSRRQFLVSLVVTGGIATAAAVAAQIAAAYIQRG